MDKRRKESRRGKEAPRASDYDLSNPKVFLELLRQYDYNYSWLAEELGMAQCTLSNRARRMGLSEEVNRLKGEQKTRRGTNKTRAELASQKQAVAAHEAHMKGIREASVGAVRALVAKVGLETARASIIQAGGVLTDAAGLLGVDVSLLHGAVSMVDELYDAVEEGERLLKVKAKDLYLRTVMGTYSPGREQSKYLLAYARAKLDISEVVTHRVSNLDVPELDDLGPLAPGFLAGRVLEGGRAVVNGEDPSEGEGDGE